MREVNSTPAAHVPMTDAERPAVLARITAKCLEEGACLIWQGCFSASGVPQLSYRGRAVSVRRVLFEALNGFAPAPGMVLAPRCRNPRCVAPECLLHITVLQLRGMDAQRGAFSRPSANAARRVAARARWVYPEPVIQRVRDFVGTCAQAAEATGVSLSHCKKIRAGTARRAVTGDVWGGLLR